MRKVISLILVIMFCFVTTVYANEDTMTPSGIPYTELKSSVDDYVSDYIGKSTAGANVLIMKDGKVIINTSYGYADINNQIKVTPETVFEWGSITKLLVWTSVMQLVEQGKLDLNEDISAYLPDGILTKLQYDAPITMLNLMHHDAGWEERYRDLFYTSHNEINTLEQMLHITEPYQIHEPGSVVAYSNFGVALAGFIVERLTDQPFYQYVNDHIFSVLDMKDTTIHPTQQDNQHIALKRNEIFGYSATSDGEFHVAKNERIYIGLYPAGSAMGTIDDLAKFMKALMPVNCETSPLFLHNRTLEDMLSTSNFYDDGFPRNAHGFWVIQHAIDVLGHAGTTNSFASQFLFSKENNLGLIILTNQKNEEDLSYGLPTLLFGRYLPESQNQALPHAQEHDGNYSWARNPYKGFTKLYGALNDINIEVKSSNKIHAFGVTYEQPIPFVYTSKDGFINDYFHTTINNGKVEKISMLTTDLLPVSQSSKIIKLLSLIAVGFSILYSVTILLYSLNQSLKNRKKAVQSSNLKMLEITLLISSIITVINTLILFLRTVNYASSAAIQIHFWIDYAFIAMVAIYLVALVLELRKNNTTPRQKIRYIFSCFSVLLVVILIFIWELFY